MTAKDQLDTSWDALKGHGSSTSTQPTPLATHKNNKMTALTPANKVQGRTPSGLSRNPSMGMFDVVGTNKEALGGVLKILVKKGKLYRDTETIGKMDPFVEIEYKNKKYRTRVKEEGGKLPVWNQTLEIPLESLLDEIKVACYDQDSFTNDLIGET